MKYFWTAPLLATTFLIGLPGAVVLAEESDDAYTQSLEFEVETEIFATKGDAVVTQADFDAFMSRIPEHDRADVLAHPERIGNMLDDLMLTRLVATEGIKDGILDDPEVGAKLYQVAMVFLAEQQFERHWEAEKLDDYGSQAKERFLLNPDDYQLEARIDFRHILLLAEEGATEESARELAERARDGEDFEALALEYSQDPSVEENRGFFAEIKRGELDSTFAGVAFDLDEGEISDPVETRFGWHVIQLVEHHEAESQEFEDVEEQLKENARARHRTRVQERYYANLLGQSQEIRPGAVRKLLDRYDMTVPEGLQEAVEEHEGTEMPEGLPDN